GIDGLSSTEFIQVLELNFLFTLDTVIAILQTAFTSKKDFGKEERELLWAHAQRTLHGLQPPDTSMFSVRSSYGELSWMAEEARRRAEIARLRELHTLKGHVESLIRLKGLDIDAIQQSYSV
ncbi:hypothetical protein CISIN_1g0105231mg, partial [Citrus sinensis]